MEEKESIEGMHLELTEIMGVDDTMEDVKRTLFGLGDILLALSEGHSEISESCYCAIMDIVSACHDRLENVSTVIRKSNGLMRELAKEGILTFYHEGIPIAHK